MNRYWLNGGWAVHTGSDLNLNDPTWNADNDMPVYAVADGLVRFAQIVPNSTWGRLVVIYHPDGNCSRYAHLSTITVGPMQRVKRGDQIGTIGGTEYGLPDHLHFDISDTMVLVTWPTFWPGDDEDAVLQHFVEPRSFIQDRHS